MATIKIRPLFIVFSFIKEIQKRNMDTGYGAGQEMGFRVCRGRGIRRHKNGETTGGTFVRKSGFIPPVDSEQKKTVTFLLFL